MPQRRDIDPVDLPTLLPHLMLIDRAEDQYRYRLVGTAVADELGRDLTRQTVGSYVTGTEYAAAIMDIYERIFTTGCALFTTGEYRARSGVVHAVSRLMVPLGEDGASVNMVLLSRVARFSASFKAGADWLKGVQGTLQNVIEVPFLAALEQAATDWEREVGLDRHPSRRRAGA